MYIISGARDQKLILGISLFWSKIQSPFLKWSKITMCECAIIILAQSFSLMCTVFLFHSLYLSSSSMFVLSLSLSLSRNIPPEATPDFLKNCTFNNTTPEGRSCPIFSLGQIVGMINQSESFYDDLATQVTCIKYTAFLWIVGTMISYCYNCFLFLSLSLVLPLREL